MLIIGLDPGLGTTGWGIIAKQGNRLSHIANGQIRTGPAAPLLHLPSCLADGDVTMAALLSSASKAMPATLSTELLGMFDAWEQGRVSFGPL